MDTFISLQLPLRKYNSYENKNVWLSLKAMMLVREPQSNNQKKFLCFSLLFLDPTYKWDHTVFVFLRLP